MNIEVLFFAHYQDVIGESTKILTVPDGVTVKALIEGLQHDYPAIGAALTHGRIAVNEEFSDGSHVLSEGDQVALMPPMSGGNH